MNKISDAAVRLVGIADISIGKRRRQKLGRLTSLTKSIQLHGLIHPIILRNGNELVSGQRRLEACKQLGWKTIPARSVELLSDQELRPIEYDENNQRLTFADFEASSARLAQIRQAEAELKAKEYCTEGVQKSRSFLSYYPREKCHGGLLDL